MPELPDLEMYRHALRERLVGAELEAVQIASPSLLRTVTPSPRDLVGDTLEDVRRLGKRIVLAFEGDRFFVIHLMVAGRFAFTPPAKTPPKLTRRGGGLAAFRFGTGTLTLREVSKKKRARLHVVEGEAALAAHDPGGLEPLGLAFVDFAAALTRENHTLKRALTDPRVLSGVGNAYSDEILHAARLPPIRWTSRLTEADLQRLYDATQTVLTRFRDRMIEELAGAFPKKVTAFRPDMAVHGKYGEPCPVCEEPVQRIRYADNETNYCARCQNAGKLLADRSLSRLLKDDWPKTLEALEELRRG